MITRSLAEDAEDSGARSRFVGQVGIEQQRVRSLWMRQKGILLVKICLFCLSLLQDEERENPGKQSCTGTMTFVSQGQAPIHLVILVSHSGDLIHAVVADTGFAVTSDAERVVADKKNDWRQRRSERTRRGTHPPRAGERDNRHRAKYGARSYCLMDQITEVGATGPDQLIGGK